MTIRTLITTMTIRTRMTTLTIRTLITTMTIKTWMTTNLAKAASLKDEVVSSAEKLPEERSRVTWIHQVTTFYSVNYAAVQVWS